MNGSTVAGKSAPCASPQAATAPLKRTCAQALTSVCEPTVSTTPAQRSLCSGLPGADSALRSTIAPAPSARSQGSSAVRPVDAVTA
jgi:hypothetical protein